MQIFFMPSDIPNFSEDLVESNVSIENFEHPAVLYMRRINLFAEVTDVTLSHMPNHEEGQIMGLVFHMNYCSLKPSQ